MLNHHVLLILGDPSIPSTHCQKAIRIFAEFDLTIPRSMIPAELDKRFDWIAGSAQRVLNMLVEKEILTSLSRGRLSSGGQHLLMISARFGWSPKSLCDQWARDLETQERVEFASASASSSS